MSFKVFFPTDVVPDQPSPSGNRTGMNRLSNIPMAEPETVIPVIVPGADPWVIDSEETGISQYYVFL